MSFITDLFGGGSTPAAPASPVAPPPPPTVEDAQVKAQSESDQVRRRMGRASTILTGAGGDSNATTATKQLLGS